MEKLWYKLQQGLKEYCDNNGFQKTVLGLSGGLDSAIVSVLAADTLGGQNVKALMMKTQYTSDLSIKIAREIAQKNNLDYQELDINPLFEKECEFLANAFGESPKPIVLENLQARLRGQILMAYSNQNKALVLACSNKSEILTGYCTLYGDTCGGLSPIGNIYKSFLFEVAQWRNQKSCALPSEVITRAPSAELAFNQKDENALPPYPLLDAILKMLYDEQKPLEEIVSNGFDASTVQKVASLVKFSAFKRKQLPEAIKC